MPIILATIHPLWFISIAIVLTIASKIPVFFAMVQESGYDNHHPRQQQARLKGWGLRAVAAHQNTLEAFPFFAAGLLTGIATGAPFNTLNILASVFLVARVLYIYLYLADRATIRSIVWGIGYFAAIGCAVIGLI
jgi:uncharacterized MAPEG superfamily protein